MLGTPRGQPRGTTWTPGLIGSLAHATNEYVFNFSSVEIVTIEQPLYDLGQQFHRVQR